MFDPKDVRTVIGEVRATYAVPFLLAMLFGAAILVLVLSAFVPGPLAWGLFGVAATLIVAALLLLAYAVLRRPDMLRSERYRAFSQVMTIIGNDELSARDKDRYVRMLDRYVGQGGADEIEGPPTRKRPADEGADE